MSWVTGCQRSRGHGQGGTNLAEDSFVLMGSGHHYCTLPFSKYLS